MCKYVPAKKKQFGGCSACVLEEAHVNVHPLKPVLVMQWGYFVVTNWGGGI